MEQIKQKKGLTRHERYIENPFMTDFTVNVREKRTVIAAGITELPAHGFQSKTTIAKVQEVDKGEFVKVYTTDVAQWLDLTKTGLRVFAHLLTVVQESKDTDTVFFEATPEFLKKIKMVKTTFYRGLDELLEKKFLARHRAQGLFYINPALFFNGDRVQFVKEYRIRKIENTWQNALFGPEELSEGGTP